MAIDITNYYEPETQVKIQRAQELAAQQKDVVNSAYDAQIQKIQTAADKNIIASENSFDAAYADNAVNQFINERQIQNANANAGLQDSGLNRTQQTAAILSKTNADNDVTAEKMSFVSKIRTQLQEDLSTAEQSRTSDLSDIDVQLLSDTNSIYNEMDDAKIAKIEEITSNIASITDPTQAAAYIKTVSSQYGIDVNELLEYSPAVNTDNYNSYLKDNNYFVNKTNYDNLQSTLAGIDTTSAAGKTAAAKQIKAWANMNGATKSQIKKLCSSAGIKYSDYVKYLNNKNYFTKTDKTEYTTLHSTLAGIDTTSAAGQTVAAKQIKAWVNTHKSATKSQIKKLCASAGISYSDYQKFLKNGQIFAEREDSKKASSSSSSGGGGSSSKSSGGSSIDVDIDDAGNDNPENEENYNNALKTLSLHYRSPNSTTMSLESVEQYINELKETYKLNDTQVESLIDIISDRYDLV